MYKKKLMQNLYFLYQPLMLKCLKKKHSKFTPVTSSEIRKSYWNIKIVLGRLYVIRFLSIKPKTKTKKNHELHFSLILNSVVECIFIIRIFCYLGFFQKMIRTPHVEDINLFGRAPMTRYSRRRVCSPISIKLSDKSWRRHYLNSQFISICVHCKNWSKTFS